MGASISFDSKYRLVLETEVECISVNPPNIKSEKKSSGVSASSKNKKGGRNDESENNSDNDDHDNSGSESSNSNNSDSDSENENKTYTVKITPEIMNYVRSYLRKNNFLDEFDLITEIELDDYNYEPGSALVFNSDSLVFMTNNQTIEAVGDWEFLPPDNQEKQTHTTSKSKSKTKSKNKSRGHNHDDGDEDDSDVEEEQRKTSKYKTKEDELPVGEIENILKEKFEEYNKAREFIIHESKNSFLCLKINSVEIVKA